VKKTVYGKIQEKAPLTRSNHIWRSTLENEMGMACSTNGGEEECI
jgi:hypothetical protein